MEKYINTNYLGFDKSRYGTVPYKIPSRPYGVGKIETLHVENVMEDLLYY